MFRRIIWEDLLQNVQVVGLFLLAVATVLLLARLLTTPDEETRRLAELPLSDD